MNYLRHNAWQLLIATDQWLNVLIGMIFHPLTQHWGDETLSSAAHRRRLAGWPLAAWLIDVLFRLFGERDHCACSYKSEREGRHLPPELR